MNIIYDSKIELFYGLNYCLNRENKNIKLYNTKEENEYINNFYHLYIENSYLIDKDLIIQMGEYSNIANYILNNNNVSNDKSFELFINFINNNDILYNQIIEDIKKDKYLNYLDFDYLKKFFNVDLGKQINIILSVFISGGFGIYNGNSNIILGVKYSNNLKRYKITGNSIPMIYHEFLHPIIAKKIYDNKIIINKRDSDVLTCYQDNYLEELLVRVFEIIFSAKIYSDNYLDWALDEQDKASFYQVREFVNLYLDNQTIIKNFEDYLNILLERKYLSITY